MSSPPSFRASNDHSWERRYHAQCQSKIDPNKMEIDNAQRVTTQRLSSCQVMSNFNNHIPSREVMQRSHALTFRPIEPIESNYKLAIAQVISSNRTPQTFLLNPSQECVFKEKQPQQKPVEWKFRINCVKTIKISGFDGAFGCNSLDWGTKLLAVNVRKTCSVFDTKIKKRISYIESDHPHYSLKWSPTGDSIGLGDSVGKVCVSDVKANKFIYDQFTHQDRLPVYSMNWKSQNELTVTPWGDITHFDIRSHSFAWSLHASPSQICSLEWSPNRQFLARSGFDKKVEVFDGRQIQKPIYSYSHNAAIKALKWMPNSSLLLSGGGVGDGIVKLFDVERGKPVFEKATNAQVCSIEHFGDRVYMIGLGFSSGSPKENIEFWEFDRGCTTLQKIHGISSVTSSVLNIAKALPHRVLSISKDPNSLQFSSLSSNGQPFKANLHYWNPETTRKKTSDSNPFSDLGSGRWSIR